MKQPQSGLHSDAYLNWFDRNNMARPDFFNHGKFDPEKLERVPVKKWHMEGNKLIGDFGEGEVTMFIDTNYILTSSEPDANGLPILRKIQ